MAAPTITGSKPSNMPTALTGDFALITWDLTTTDHTGDAAEYPDYADRTVQFIATAAGSATAKLEGSLDGTNWVSLADPQGNEISKTASGIEAVLEAVRYVRPRLTTPGTAAVWKVILYVRKTP